jgi:hypothetical protein
MFPPTDSAKRAFDVFPTTDNVKDINPPRSLHIERQNNILIVVLIKHLKTSKSHWQN